ncbi:hypothetical protein ACFQPF_03270 [Fictibacillus iocasae]|uniref:Uncharacterized protein n=1 Tax=Fictibacillus iocasae TaxID=2715437 RepID=A0ABW2NMI7_9BACL
MGRQKKGNQNAQSNNNAKGKNDTMNEMASYAEVETNKMHHGKKTK